MLEGVEPGRQGDLCWTVCYLEEYENWIAQDFKLKNIFTCHDRSGAVILLTHVGCGENLSFCQAWWMGFEPSILGSRILWCSQHHNYVWLWRLHVVIDFGRKLGN